MDTNDNEANRTMVNWYQSLGELYEDAKQTQLPVSLRGMPQSFLGHHNPREAVEYCRHGLTQNDTQEARELFNKIDTSFRDRTRTEWMPSVAGAYACVPEYLQGQPEHMRLMHDNVADSSPIRYWVESGCSEGTSQRAIQRQAAAVGALIMRTSEERPVELMVFTGGQSDRYKGLIAIAPIDSHPVDLVEVIATLGTREFARTISFSLLGKYCGVGGCINWTCGYPGEKREQKLRTILGASPQDVIVQGAFLPDEGLLRNNPVAWVHKQLDKQRSVEL